MKKRKGFVSNSSTSSFVIAKGHLTSLQIWAIKNHTIVGKDLNVEYTNYPWTIGEDDFNIIGDTDMDNFDMEDFLEKIGVPSDKIHWSGGY